MRKIVLSLVMAASVFSMKSYAQVGVNTSNPQGAFTIDGAKDDAATGVPTIAQQLNDFTITSTGSVGVGNVAPAAKVDIVGDTFGIKRNQGSGSWDNIWIDLSNTSAPTINASGAETGLQFNVGANSVGTYGDGQTLTTVATMRPNGNMGVGIALPLARLHVDGGETRFGNTTSQWSVSPSTGGTTGSSNSFEIIDRVNNVRRMVFNDNGDMSFGGTIVNNSAAGVVSVRGGNVGLNNGTPTDLLDVNGTARIRSITPVASGATVVLPVYSDVNGVLVKASPSVTYGSVISNLSASIASGATGTLITGMVDGGIYKATIMAGDACAYATLADFYVFNSSANTNFSIKGVDGLLSNSTTKGPTFTETNRTTTAVTWTGKPTCADGGNSTALNYTVVMPSAGTINVTNNGNIARAYRIILTRLN